MTDKGWKFTGNERKYLDDVLKSGFGASETGTMNERLENYFADIQKWAHHPCFRCCNTKHL